MWLTFVLCCEMPLPNIDYRVTIVRDLHSIGITSVVGFSGYRFQLRRFSTFSFCVLLCCKLFYAGIVILSFRIDVFRLQNPWVWNRPHSPPTLAADPSSDRLDKRSPCCAKLRLFRCQRSGGLFTYLENCLGEWSYSVPHSGFLLEPCRWSRTMGVRSECLYFSPSFRTGRK